MKVVSLPLRTFLPWSSIHVVVCNTPCQRFNGHHQGPRDGGRGPRPDRPDGVFWIGRSDHGPAQCAHCFDKMMNYVCGRKTRFFSLSSFISSSSSPWSVELATHVCVCMCVAFGHGWHLNLHPLHLCVLSMMGGGREGGCFDDGMEANLEIAFHFVCIILFCNPSFARMEPPLRPGPSKDSSKFQAFSGWPLATKLEQKKGTKSLGEKPVSGRARWPLRLTFTQKVCFLL